MTWPERFDSLSAWLAANSNVGITQLIACAPAQQPSLLQFPSLQQLPGLQCLHCDGLTVTAALSGSNSSEAGAAAAAQAAHAAASMPLELFPATALTALLLERCRVQLLGLSAPTRLQRLSVGAPIYCLPDSVTSNLRTQLQQALPQLQALTFLRLFGKVAHDDVLQHVSSLPRLQDLTLMDGMFTLASFQQLPHLGQSVSGCLAV